MRRLLCATAVSGALLLLGAGCSSDDPAGSTAAPTPLASAGAGSAAAPASGAPASGDVAVGEVALPGNSEVICVQAAKAAGDAGQSFAQDLKLLIDAQSAQDAGRVAKAKAKTARDVGDYSHTLTELAKSASEPALKAALTDLGEQVTALGGDVFTIDAAQLTALRETLDKACGKG